MNLIFHVDAHYSGQRYTDGKPRIVLKCLQGAAVDCTITVPVEYLADYPIGSQWHGNLVNITDEAANVK